MLVEGRYRAEGSKGEKKWDKYYSVTNKIYVKKENSKVKRI